MTALTEQNPEYRLSQPLRYSSRALGAFCALSAVLTEVTGISELVAGHHEQAEHLIVQGITPTGIVAAALLWASFSRRPQSAE